MKWIDDWLERITMYRLLLYYLIALLAVAVVLSLFGQMHINPLDIVLTSLYLAAVCWVTNKVFAWGFDAPTNVDSSFITALILALIITPSSQAENLVFITAAGGLAIASKYVLAINRRHIFNPAAIAVVLTDLGAGDAASWWVGTAPMLPFVIIGGLLLVRKIRRWEMTLSFIGATFVATAVYTWLAHGNVVATLQKEVLSSAVFFAAFVMLTEPLTSPTTKGKQTWYGAIVGALFPPQIHLGGLYSTPELALAVGNVFAYVVGPRVKQMLRPIMREKLSHDTYDFVFEPEKPFTYKAGQYVEVTLQHPKTDARGARRYFTLASSPTEKELRFGVKFYQNGSSYKRALYNIQGTTPIIAGQLGGNFVLPKNPAQKIVFIAGGIGVTPYRSMVKYLLDTNQPRPITLLYSANDIDNFVYRELFDEAQKKLGIKVVYALTGDDTGGDAAVHHGQITADLVRKEVPDFTERLFYLSGPHNMVVALERTLRELGVPHRHIKKDFFSGYA